MKTATVFCTVLVFLLSSVTSPLAAEKQKVSFYNGPPQGGWRPIAVAIQQVIQKAIPNLEVNIEPGGGAANVIAVDSKPGVFAMVTSTSTYDGFLGRPPFKKKMENLREIAILFTQPAHMITFADGPIKTVESLKGKRISVTPRGYASETVNQMILKAHGLDYKDVQPQFLGEIDSIDSMRDGHLDAFLIMTSVPYPLFLELASARKVSLLSLSPGKIRELSRENKGLRPYTIKAGSYPQINSDVTTFESSVHVAANKEMPDALAEQITKALVEALPDLQKNFAFMKGLSPNDMGGDLGIPFHPGAARFYQSRGLMK